MEVNWTLIIILVICLVSVDKIITYYNIKAVEKNFPEIDKFEIEKNPIAKYFFKNFGLIWGSVLFVFLSIVTFFFALGLITWCLILLGVNNAFSISLWVVIIIYFLTIGNNLYFFLKFSRIIP